MRTLVFVIGLTVVCSGCQAWSSGGRRTTTQPIDGSASIHSRGPLGASGRADIQLAFAQVAEQRGEYERAMEAYNAALSMDPTRWDARHRLALIHDRLGNTEDAEALYRQIEEAGQADVTVLCDYGYNLYLQERWPEAESKFHAALQKEPRHQRAHNQLGMLLARTGRFDASLSEFRLAGLSEQDARLNLAFAMMVEGQLEPAREQIAIVRSLPPRPSAAARLTQLENWANRAAQAHSGLASYR